MEDNSSKITIIALVDSKIDNQKLTDQLQLQGLYNCKFFDTKSAILSFISAHPVSSHYLYLELIQDIVFDLDYYLQSSMPDDSALLQYQLNDGRPLAFIDQDFNIINISKACDSTYDGLAPTGIFCLSGKILSHYIQAPNEFFNNLKTCPLKGIPVPKNTKTPIDTGQRKPVLFLDRDGVINEDRGYVYKIEDISICDGIVDLIKCANQLNWYVCIITNQSGIARDKYTEDDVKSLHLYIEDLLAKQNAHIDRWEYCPFYDKSGPGPYDKDSILRKPGPGMILLSCQDLPVDLSASYMVGDKISDKIWMKGITTIHIQGGYDLSGSTDLVFPSILDILQFICKQSSMKS
ncbi:MAG: HAD-IIIA family hydrolase [Bacteriovoracaceae bacterium]|nr:HAD-IIIA family hydrolase [Bacteriovoracaceae bacterium]